MKTKTKSENFYSCYLKYPNNKHLKRLIKEMITDIHYVYKCDCAKFQSRIGITINIQDLRELNYKACPYCKKPFKIIK